MSLSESDNSVKAALEGPGMASYSSLCSASQTHTSRCVGLLPALLSVIAGSADVTSFLGLGLFSSHVTGNLVILTAHVVARRADNACLR